MPYATHPPVSPQIFKVLLKDDNHTPDMESIELETTAREFIEYVDDMNLPVAVTHRVLETALLAEDIDEQFSEAFEQAEQIVSMQAGGEGAEDAEDAIGAIKDELGTATNEETSLAVEERGALDTAALGILPTFEEPVIEDRRPLRHPNHLVRFNRVFDERSRRTLHLVDEELLFQDENNLPDKISITNPHLCVACHCDFAKEQPVLTACGHLWHKDCINQCFRVALQSRTNWPAKCCHRREGLDSCAVQAYLDADVTQLLSQKEEEYSTPNPTYCPKCLRFLPKKDFDGLWVSCCSTIICVKCSVPRVDHIISVSQVVCPEKLSPEDRALVDQEGWKPCPTYHQLIDRKEGCNQMRCSICKTKFCYKCGHTRDAIDRCGCEIWGFE